MKQLRSITTPEQLDMIISNQLTLVAFGTPDSPPCKIQYQKILEFLSTITDELAAARVDVDHYPELAGKCNIQTVPTIITYGNNKEITRQVGLQSVQALRNLINASRIRRK